MVAAKRLAGVAFKGDVRNQSIMLNPSDTYWRDLPWFGNPGQPPIKVKNKAFKNEEPQKCRKITK